MEGFEVCSMSLEPADGEEEMGSVDAELIKLVRSNPILWNNNLAEYKNTELRNLTWESVGVNLSVPISGADACKKFNNLRTVFARHFKKVREDEPRSGAGADGAQYVPTWPLFNELLFLRDVIKPRTTKSNFARPISVAKKLKLEGMRPVSFASLKMTSNSGPTVAPPSLITASQMERAVTQAVTDPLEGTSNSPRPSSSNHNDWLRDVVSTDTGSASESDTTSVSSKTSRPDVISPPPDKFYRRKRSQEAAGAAAMEEIAGCIKNLTNTVTARANSSARNASTNVLDAELEAYLQIVRSSIARISPRRHLACLQDIITVLRKYEEMP